MSVVKAYKLFQWSEHINCVNGWSISIVSVIGAYELSVIETYELYQWLKHINCISSWSILIVSVVGA